MATFLQEDEEAAINRNRPQTIPSDILRPRRVGHHWVAFTLDLHIYAVYVWGIVPEIVDVLNA